MCFKSRARAENPLELHRISLRVQDVNDNSPYFGKDEINLEIRDPPIRANASYLKQMMRILGKILYSYAIQSNGYFLYPCKSNSLERNTPNSF